MFHTIHEALRNFFWLFAKAYKKFNADRCPLLASALVQATAFSLFPLILGMISLSLFVLGSSEAIMDKLIPILKQVFPIGIEDIIRNISTIKQTSITIAVIGLIGFLWGAASIFRALESTLNLIWKVKKDRPFFKKSLLSIGSAFLVFVLLFDSIGITIWIKAIGASGLARFLPEFSAFFSVVLFGLVYRYFPHRRVPLAAAYFGAIFTGLLWELVKYLFAIYLTQVVDYSKIFGSLSAIILLFLWLYYLAYIFLFGAELSYVYARRKVLR